MWSSVALETELYNNNNYQPYSNIPSTNASQSFLSQVVLPPEGNFHDRYHTAEVKPANSYRESQRKTRNMIIRNVSGRQQVYDYIGEVVATFQP